MKSLLAALLPLLLVATACRAPDSGHTPTPSASPTIPPTARRATTAPPADEPKATTTLFAYTHLRADGNRFLQGSGGSLDTAQSIDIPLSDSPRWLLALPDGTASLWVAVLADGRVEAFRLQEARTVSIPITPDNIPAGQPPLAAWDGQTLRLLAPPAGLPASPLTAPLPLPASDQTAFLLTDGDLVFVDAQGSPTTRLAINALPDARLLRDEEGRVLVLTHPSPAYDHGVLGDALEATAITLIETRPTPRILNRIDIPQGKVIEGLAPLWWDWDGDGQREIVVTVSDARAGAQLLVFSETGDLLAQGEAIGQGYRWRHQIAIAPFGPGGEWELSDVLTPHIGGVVEFFSWAGGQLQQRATQAGYTSHVIYTRNLDLALAGDFNADGRAELLLPAQDRRSLELLAHQADGVQVLTTLPLEGELSTNLTGVTLKNGEIIIGAGRADHILRLWIGTHP